ncbi:MAG: hypothetical protein BECKG1743E_GA0114224_106271, partial [Candidatus Kentron sp. G]
RIVHYVTVIATQKLDDKDKQVGIFFDRNRLSLIDPRESTSEREYSEVVLSGSLSKKPDRIDSDSESRYR